MGVSCLTIDCGSGGFESWWADLVVGWMIYEYIVLGSRWVGVLVVRRRGGGMVVVMAMAVGVG